MIQPNELRIGNLFHPIARDTVIQLPATGIFFKVVEICAFSVNAVLQDQNPAQVENWQNIPYNDLSAIQLSAEILEKCGFKKQGNWSWLHKGKDEMLCFEFKYYKGHDRMCLQLFVGGAWEYPYGEKIKTLHGLQNLYFALTGEELQINL